MDTLEALTHALETYGETHGRLLREAVENLQAEYHEDHGWTWVDGSVGLCTARENDLVEWGRMLTESSGADYSEWCSYTEIESLS